MNAAAQALSERLQQSKRLTGTLKLEYYLPFLFLIGIVLASALGLIYCKERYRCMQVELQTLQQQREKLWLEERQLVLEHSTWAMPARVQTIAAEQLNMGPPKAIHILHL